MGRTFGEGRSAIGTQRRPPHGATFGDVVRVIGDYVRALGPALPSLGRPSKRAAFGGLGASAIGLVVTSAFATQGERIALLIVLAGFAASAAATWFAAPSVAPRVTAAREAELRTELEQLADSRVALVIRQFEWAVNDVEKLRQAVRRADAGRLAAEKKTAELDLRVRQFRHMVEQAHTQLAAYRAEPLQIPEAAWSAEPVRAVALRWAIHDDGVVHWMHLETDDTDVRRVRLVDADGHVLTLSDPARQASVRADGPVGMALELSVPPAVASDLAAGNAAAHRFQALVGEEWRAVDLSDTGLRTGSAKDKRNRFYTAEAARSIA
ncbi:MAG TPA: hypothetical protein VGT60_03530 [Candidatus Limnocylindria bacterium]|nr:hypothetical protein [Candidatus Limnocylindria bacterium]